MRQRLPRRRKPSPNLCWDGACGTVFRITPSGALTTLYSFCSQPNCTDGSGAYAGLVQASDGSLYGTTFMGGAYLCGSYACGTVFRITLAGMLTTLHSFDGSDGQLIYAGLVQASDRSFYGTTAGGGAYNYCTFGCGTVFKITPWGTLTTLHSFDGSDGDYPDAGLVQARDGSFYGTTRAGGADADGAIFRLGVVQSCATCRP